VAVTVIVPETTCPSIGFVRVTTPSLPTPLASGIAIRAAERIATILADFRNFISNYVSDKPELSLSCKSESDMLYSEHEEEILQRESGEAEEAQGFLLSE